MASLHGESSSYLRGKQLEVKGTFCDFKERVWRIRVYRLKMLAEKMLRTRCSQGVVEMASDNLFGMLIPRLLIRKINITPTFGHTMSCGAGHVFS